MSRRVHTSLEPCEHDSGMPLSLSAFMSYNFDLVAIRLRNVAPCLKQGGQFECPCIMNADDFVSQRAVIPLRW